MVSIKDVAKHAGVAISTVSKVLNNYPNVSEDTKKKVNEAVKELNFLPNSVAAALSSKQAGRVALLINLNTRTQAIDEIDMRYISGAINKAAELGLDVNTFFFSMFEDMTEDEIVRYLCSQRIHGIIICGLSQNDTVLQNILRSQVFKAVVVDAPIVNESTSCVSIDQEKAQYDVAKKTVMDNKCKNILYIAGKQNGYVTEERLKGIRRLAQELDMDLLIREGEFSEKKAREITFQEARKRDIVVCASDLMAIGAMRALMEMDIFRPVCGFDGITLMGYAGKQMNTVRQDFKRIASEAAKELKRLLEGGDGQQIVLDYELVRMKYTDVLA
ncbi:MAG TPA: LacI family transcriptional regulator [Lachnospiraceae bacterium]|nr:LacI family transcriptional regulator [Lachnospiraceae bacterium]